jgi:hypothetical protein
VVTAKRDIATRNLRFERNMGPATLGGILVECGLRLRPWDDLSLPSRLRVALAIETVSVRKRRRLLPHGRMP